MQSINENFYCPITLNIMKDPVIGPDGQTYERSAIEQWLRTSNKSPITKQIMSSNQLIPNISLRNTIETFNSSVMAQQPVFIQSVVPDIQYKDIVINGYVNKTIDATQLYVKLTPNETSKRNPCNIVFVIDVSGSMSSLCSESSNTTNTEASLYTRLDIVKYAITTIIELLNSNDSICLITFSNDAVVKLIMTQMTDIGKTQAKQILNSISTGGSTNIWDGLRQSLNVVKEITDSNVNISVMLLTDGEPNINPPRGIIPTLEISLKLQKIKQSFTINTFGFGYSLDSELLNGISKCGSGIYGYIPDHTMVGTIFINFMSNLLATYSSNSKLEIVCDDPDVRIIGNTNVGSIIFDQPRELLYKLENINRPTNMILKLLLADTVIKTIEFIVNPNELLNNSSLITTIIRYKIIEEINELLENSNIQLSQQKLEILYGKIKELLLNSSLTAKDKEILNNYYSDYKSTIKNKGGQINEAFSNISAYKKWGAHFIRSLINAYENQQCNNFKDPGVQHFGGLLFNSIRDLADEIFCNLPAPKSTIRNNTSYTSSYNSSSTYVPTYAYALPPSNPTPDNMRGFYNNCGSCFDGEGLVTLDNDNKKPVKFIRKGDVVTTFDKNNNIMKTKVACVIVSYVKTGQLSMCQLNNVKITPWHPVKYNDKWKFPVNLIQSSIINIDCIYNIVLEEGHILIINNLFVVTLGHDFNDPVVSHPYYGSKLIINDLVQMDGWDEGLIIMNNPSVSRSNGFVNKFYDAK